MPYLDDVLNPYQSLTGDLTPEDTLTGLLSEDGLLQGAIAISDVVGVTELTELTDVSITNPLNNDVLTYNDVTEKWENMPAQGGGGGTSDYEDLDNKPSINSVTLTGNQTTTTLGLFSGDYDELTNKPELAAVATSGDYDDLTNTPTIPAAQVNSDWNAASGVAQILNKPTIPNLTPVDVTSQITITKSSGNWSVNTYSAYRTGNVVTLYIKFEGNGSAVNAGSNAFQGNVSGIRPILLSYGTAYISSSATVAGLWSTGSITVRVTGANVTLGTGNTSEFSITYITND